MNRRNFIKYLGTFAGAAALHTPSFVPLYTLFKTFSKEQKEIEVMSEDDKELASEEKNKILGDYNYINVKHKYDIGSFHNYGVRHTEQAFNVQKEDIIKLIDENDIIALEADKKSYFSKIAQYAREQGKEVFNIDPTNDLTVQSSISIAVVNPLLALANINSFEQLLNNKKIRWFIKTILINGLSVTYSALPSSLIPLSYRNDQEYFGKGDISYTIDGRTVFMTNNIQEIIHQNSEKNILAITGNFHAQGIEYYLKNTDILNRRLKIYNLLYGYFSSDLREYQ